MFYTIGEAAKILNVAPSTLRYYDKEGLLPFVERSSGGIRVFKKSDFNWLSIIECLKKSGLSIKEIKHYMELVFNGDETIDERYGMFQNQRKKVLARISELQKTLDILNYKCWYYEKAKAAGTTEHLKNIPIEEVPEELRAARESLSIRKG